MRNIVLILKDSQGYRILFRFILVIIVSLLTAFLLAPEWEKSYAVIHTVLEIFCIVIAISSFFVVWCVSKIQQTNLILGLGFLAVAIFDALHTIFWQGLGLFPNSFYDLSARYWLAGRFFEALFLILSTISISKFSIGRYIGFAFTVFFSFSVGFAFYYSPDAFPVLLTPKGVTPIKIIIEYIIISMFICFLFRVYKGFFQEDIVTKEYLILAILIAVPAELCFTVFTTITNFYNVLGHVLKISYYYFFLKAVFAGFVVFPYKRLRLSEERFHKVFQYSPVLKSILAMKDSRFIDVNNMWLQTTGYTREEVIGKTPQELNLYSNEDMGKYQREIVSDRRITNQRNTFRTKNGVSREGVFSTQKIVLNDEPCVLMVTMDITDQVRNEKELLRLDRLNLIGQMAAGIGHEVRNPMTTVRGFLQMLGKKPKFADEKEYFDLMISELDRANTLITDFLSLARDTPVELEPFNLSQIVEDIFPLLQADAFNVGKNIEIEKHPTPDVNVNKNEIHQLILNLGHNGLDATQKGGCVTVKTFVDTEDVILAVKDEGGGIDPNILDKLGTPFVTTKAEGTGLGLATCYSIAERHNARIEVNTSSEGTTFSVRFKAAG